MMILEVAIAFLGHIIFDPQSYFWCSWSISEYNHAYNPHKLGYNPFLMTIDLLLEWNCSHIKQASGIVATPNLLRKI